MAETERESIRESTLEGLDTAARKGKHGGRPRSSPTTYSTPCSGAGRSASPSSISNPTCSSPPASERDRTPRWPASTGRSPNTPSARHTPKPSRQPAPTSPPSMRPANSPGPALLSLIERHSDYRERLVTSP
ncbi:hypothetical protein [Streptomyces sp. NPDC088726]|uniref:hypothetical protein n=1 Tax=Streptomyces sp. NPDC088726 TaxID=3365874 RepID=UPI00380D16D3